MNEDLNLIEILKEVPKGTKLYCTIWGDVELVDVQPLWIKCKTPKGNEWTFEPDGKLSAGALGNGECVLFPSKEQRDWSKFKLDLPIDTPVMVTDESAFNFAWILAFYCKDDMVFINGYKSSETNSTEVWDYIVPVKDFDFNDPKSNKEKSIC